MERTFKKQTLSERVKTMLKVDLRRMFTTPLFYIMLGICLVVPIAIILMTEMNAGSITVNPETGEETVVEGFKSVWQAMSSLPGESSGMSMDLTSMCNMNMIYFAVGVFVCLFVSSEFRSGYAKNLFTTRAKKNDYVISKTIVGIIAGMGMILAYFIGMLVGGKIAGLSFDMVGFNGVNVFLCLLAKLALVAVFVPIFLTFATVGKQRSWLSIVLSLSAGMLLFMMIPMMTPLTATFHFIFCIAGGAMFSIGLGAVSNLILSKTNIV